jgi:hypothetical protein
MGGTRCEGEQPEVMGDAREQSAAAGAARIAHDAAVPPGWEPDLFTHLSALSIEELPGLLRTNTLRG